MEKTEDYQAQLVTDNIKNKNIDVKASIKECILKHNKEIREHQVDAIYDIMYAFLYEGYTNVVLNASTGLGKSIIGIVVYEVLEALFKNANVKTVENDYIFVQNNNLVDQYENDYSETIDSFLVVKGANNYPCLIHRDNTASECQFAKYKIKGDKLKMSICRNCKYLINRASIDYSKIVTTNYQYYITKSLYAGGNDLRLLSIYDESHLFSDSFVGFVSFDYTIDLLTGINTTMQKFKLESEFKNEIDDLIKAISKISTKNYKKHIDKFIILLRKIVKKFTDESDELNVNGDEEQSMQYKKVAVRLSRYLSNMALYNNTEFEFVTSELLHEQTKARVGISLRPIFIKGLFENTICGKYNLFMSGTNDQVSFDIEVGLQNYKYINLEPVFPKESKKLHFLNYASLTSTVMQNSDTIKDINDMIDGIIKIEKGKNGVIHTNSFDMSYMFERELKKRKTLIKIFCQRRGDKVNDYVIAFKECKEPALLISPSCWEGVDFPYKECEFMFIPRMPFGFYGDARQKYIANNYRDLYNVKALKSVIQMIGRGTRAIDDHCTTYIFDSRIYNIFNSRLNVWKNEFDYEVD